MFENVVNLKKANRKKQQTLQIFLLKKINLYDSTNFCRTV